MKFVFISKNGDILPLAQRVEAEGNEVVFFLATEDTIIDRHVIDIGPDLVIIDSPGFGVFSQRLKKLGFPVIGGSLLSDTLKNDSNYHTRFLKTCGLYTNGMGLPLGSIPIDIEGWFNGKSFTAILYTVNSVTFPGYKEDKLYTEGISRMVTPLSRNGYVGPISIRAYVYKDQVIYEHVKASFTLPTMLSIMEGIPNSVSTVLNGLANGSNRWVMFKPGFFVAIQLILSPHEVLESNQYYNSLVQGLMKENLKHIWTYGLKKDGENYLYNGSDGRFGVVTSRGDTVSEARRRVSRTIEGKTYIDPVTQKKTTKGGIKVDNMMYLKTTGNKADYQHSKIREWGWIR